MERLKGGDMTEKDLLRVANLKQEKERIEERMERQRSILYPKIPTLTGMPRSHKQEDMIANAVASYMDLEQRYLLVTIDLISAWEEVEEVVEKLDDSFERETIRLRYLFCMKWDDIAEELQKSNSQARRYRRSALDKLRRMQ